MQSGVISSLSLFKSVGLFLVSFCITVMGLMVHNIVMLYICGKITHSFVHLSAHLVNTLDST
jgi:hypothetical protein